MKRIYNNMTKYRDFFITPLVLARRVLLIFVLFLIGAGNVVAQTVTGKTITHYVAADDGVTKGNNYTANLQSDVVDAFTELGETLDANNCFIRWDFKNSNSDYVPMNKDYAGPGQIQVTGINGNISRVSGNNIYIYKDQDWQVSPVDGGLSANLTFGTGVFQLGSVLECYVTNNGRKESSDPDSYIVKVEIRFTEDGLPPDDFFGTYSGTEPTPFNIEIPSNTTSKEVSFVIATADAKYARFVLMKDGEVQTISSTAIAVTGGQSSSDKPKRGVYVYNSSGLGSSINVTLALDEGTYEDYQLVAYFADEAPTLDGDNITITQEPATLDEKQIYSFSYPVTTIDKYIAWNTNTTTIDLASLIAEDLPTLTNTSATGYIGWSIYDGPYGTGSHVNIQGNHWNASVAPDWAMNFNQNPTQQVWSISNGQISGSWNAYTNVPVYAPGSQKFEEYPAYVVVAEVSDVSSDKIKVRYVFHFNADGQPPYEFINETDIAANKIVVPITDYEAASGVLDVSDALVSGAKYARIYLEKYGNANAQSENLTITYDGNPMTQCATGNEKYGWYLSEDGGIDVSKLSVTGLTADDMMKYSLVIVSSTNELTGDQEPAWEKKTIYSLQRIIKNRINASESEQGTGAINIQSDILSRLDATVANFSKSLYAKWYIESPSGNRQPIVDGSGANNASSWTFSIVNGSSGHWVNEDNIFKFYTDQSGNAFSSSSMIERGTYYTSPTETDAAWYNEIAKAAGVFVTQNRHTSDYVGYKIVFEFSDDYDTSTDGADPGYRLKYVWTIIDPNAFTGELSLTGVTDGKTQEVARDAASVDVDLTSGANAHAKLSSSDLKYARFYLTDANGNLVNPAGKLTVTYNGTSDNITACTNTEEGYYIYLGLDGDDNIQTLDKSLISVTLTAPKAYKMYKVVGVFSTEMTEMIPETGATPLTREPDWELQYTYDFAYPAPTTHLIEITIPWAKTGMKLDASTDNVETDWGISFEELSAGQNVKWYVERVQQNPGPFGGGTTITRQDLVKGSARVANTWVIDPASAYIVNETTDEAILTGLSNFTETNWNDAWSSPTIYAPLTPRLGGGYNANNYNDLRNCRFVCEVSTDEGTTPYVRYIFTMEKFLGELKDEGAEGEETIMLTDRTITQYEVPLDNIYSELNIPDGQKIVYARVWLTNTDGTAVDPAGKLSWSQMYGTYNQAHVFSGDRSIYGWYFCSADIGEHHSGMTHGQLGNATLTLPVGTYTQYQVHVALSTTNPTGMNWNNTNSSWEYANVGGSAEPDYDYVYTFNFDYGFEASNINTVKTKYKTTLYNEETGQVTPHLFRNWPEVAADCDVTKSVLAEKGYARWYLEDCSGNRIQFKELTSNEPYTSLGNTYGYYRYKFNENNFNNQRGLTDNGYDPTIILPELPEGCTYDQVRLICVVTTKTTPKTGDPTLPADIPLQEPLELQVKYVYTLRTQADLEAQPFVHYEGEGYRYLKEIGEDERAIKYDYTIPDEATGVQGYVWDSSTNSYTTTTEKVRQNVHTVDYYYYLNLNENETTSLLLPLQYYETTGNDTEPRGYFRWYDYKTDATSTYLTNPGSNLVEKDYGYIALPFGDDPTQARIGIDFKAPAGFSGFTDEILIACDVSRYLDGMDDSFTYLVHEPTISVRYMFHILPASVIANEIASKANANSNTGKTGLAAVEEKIMTKAPADKISILENDGRVVISTNGGVGDFTLRTDLSSLGYYYVYNGGNLTPTTQLQWYAYYEDIHGNWWKKTIDMGERGNGIQAKYNLNDFNSGTWVSLSGSGTPPTSIGVDDRVQMVACAGAGGVEMPIIWTELVFLDAAPQEIGSETEERTVAYMNKEYSHAKTLDFNNFFLIGLKTPESSFENYTKIPLEIPDAQYGFCYPQLYGLCATNKFAGWGEYGISPLHGDYTLLKSMNMDGVSKIWDTNQSINCRWWWGDPLFDVTHERANAKGTSDTNDYGAFLYVDAADEARTIAFLEFDAALCHDAKIYYTAYVASMTNNITKPMVRFRVLTDGENPGERVPVVTFVTGDLYSELGTNPYESDEARWRHEGKWYQVYGHTTIPSDLNHLLNGSTRHYYVEIDNYCDNTEGADYCVDQISFYTQSSKVKAHVINDICDGEDDKATVNLFADAKTLIDQLGSQEAIEGKKTVFYRIYKKIDDVNHVIQEGEELTGTNVYTDADGNNNDLYGAVTIDLSYDWEHVTSTTPVGGIHSNGSPDTNSGFYKGTDGNIYFQFVNRGFVLEPGKKFFVSFYDITSSTVGAPSGWGNPYNGNACSVYSNDIIANKLYLDLMDGDSEESSDGTVNFACGVTEVTKSYNIKIQYPAEDGSYRTYNDISFDFFLMTNTENAKESFVSIPGLYEALVAFRDIDQNAYANSADLPAASGSFTAEMRALIIEYMNHTEEQGKLLLSASTQFSYKFTSPGEKHFAALPVAKKTSDDDDICSPIDMKFNVDDSSSGPQMTLGFDDVDYPASYKKQVVRVGLEQLKMMMDPDPDNRYLLHIPVKSFQDKGQGTTKKLYFPKAVVDPYADPSSYLTISAVDKTKELAEQVPQTSDPTLVNEANAVGKIVAKIISPTGAGDPYVDKTHMYLPLDFSVCQIDFHEGYEYEIATSFMDEDDLDDANPCFGDIFLVIKVVPEFVTWYAAPLTTLHDIDYYNASWYYDGNWNRSQRYQLYKGTVTDAATADNHASAGHPDGYKDNDELDDMLIGNPGYVPMKFTYVTLPTNNHAPNLINEPKVEADGKSSASQGGALIDPSLLTGTQMYTDPSPFTNETSSYPTTNIRYDMLVRYGTHTDANGLGCFGHRYLKDDGTWDNHGESHTYGRPNRASKVFDVEKFYGNICKEIYFQPESELLRQQRLTYEKAWVEKELIANKWYLMSAPLKDTYAGDMYVPYSDDITLNGRQLTEAFQPITFDKSKGYSRTKYPFYQRSWGNKHGNVYTKENDIRANSYSANINFSAVTSVGVEWGHTFNDVQVPYNTMTGFSIRAHKKDQKYSDEELPAMIRLPKADTSYEYYDWSDTNSDPAGGEGVKTVSKTYANRLVTDDHTNDGDLTFNISDMQQVDDYVLVGNPYMSSIEMEKFFDVNTGLVKGYWTYEANVASAQLTTGLIRPLQAFFVKKGTASTITFTRGMQIDGNYPNTPLSSDEPGNGVRRWVAMTVSSDNGSSFASVEISEESSADFVGGEDVETLFDSNLEGVPMVFTVAGDKAVSIDRRSALDMVPFGVACGTSNELVQLTVDRGQLTADGGQLFVFDAVTGDVTEIGMERTFAVQPNDYGRYFLTTNKDITGIREAQAEEGVVVSVRDHELTVRSALELKSVRVLNANGVVVASLRDGGLETTINLAVGGIYIVEIQTAASRKTIKIVVR